MVMALEHWKGLGPNYEGIQQNLMFDQIFRNSSDQEPFKELPNIKSTISNNNYEKWWN